MSVMVTMLVSKVNEAVELIEHYINRKNEYNQAYIGSQEKIPSLERDIVECDEPTDSQANIIKELEDMCVTYSQYVNEGADEEECEDCDGCLKIVIALILLRNVVNTLVKG